MNIETPLNLAVPNFLDMLDGKMKSHHICSSLSNPPPPGLPFFVSSATSLASTAYSHKEAVFEGLAQYLARNTHDGRRLTAQIHKVLTTLGDFKLDCS